MEEKKGFFAEFKEFISRGNVMDMAVGVVIGGAFTSIVTSLVNDIIMPVVGVIIGGIDFSGLSVKVGSATVGYGSFIQAVIVFLLISLVVFIMVRSVNRMMNTKKEEAPEEPAAPSEEVQLLTEIRDLLSKKEN